MDLKGEKRSDVVVEKGLQRRVTSFPASGFGEGLAEIFRFFPLFPKTFRNKGFEFGKMKVFSSQDI